MSQTSITPAAVPLQAKWKSLVLPILVIILVGAVSLLLWGDLSREMSGIVGAIAMLATMGIGVPIAYAMALGGAVGLYALAGPRVVQSALEGMPFSSSTNWAYSVLPMFLLMGIMLWRSGISDNIFRAAQAWLNWLPGGLAVATNFAGAGLAAVSGSTIGISMALSKIALPEMLRLGYDRGLSTGVVIMAGTLGQLIPPSVLLVIYAGIAQVPVGPLMMAALVPGIITAFAYTLMIVLRSLANPSLAPRSPKRFTLAEKLEVSKSVWPLPLLMLIIIGGMFSGIFTATEAGAYAAAFSIAITFIYSGRKTFSQVGGALVDAATATGVIMVLIVGVTLLNRFLALSGLPFAVSGFVEAMEFGRVEFLIAVMILYIVLGMFMDPLAIMLLTTPVLAPTLDSLGIDMIWYGIFAVIMGELAVVTPPVGILSFIVHKLSNSPEIRGNAPPIKLGEVFKGGGWFVATQVLVVFLLIAFPEIVEWLPKISSAS